MLTTRWRQRVGATPVRRFASSPSRGPDSRGTHGFVDPLERLSAVAMTSTAIAGAIGACPEALRDAVYGAVTGRGSCLGGAVTGKQLIPATAVVQNL